MGLFHGPCIRIWHCPMRVWTCPLRVYTVAVGCTDMHMEQSHTHMGLSHTRILSCSCCYPAATVYAYGTVPYVYACNHRLYTVAIGPVTGHDFHSYRFGSMIRVKLRQFSIKVAKKFSIENHNIELNETRTRDCLLEGPERYQLTTNANNPAALVLSI